MLREQTWVPVDDTSCWIYTYSWVPDRPLTNAERTKYASGLSLHAEIDEHYVPMPGTNPAQHQTRFVELADLG